VQLAPWTGLPEGQQLLWPVPSLADVSNRREFPCAEFFQAAVENWRQEAEENVATYNYFYFLISAWCKEQRRQWLMIVESIVVQ
jgi:hypothetical protein